MCAPLCATDGIVFGALLLDTCDRARPFTGNDLGNLTEVAGALALAMEQERHRDE